MADREAGLGRPRTAQERAVQIPVDSTAVEGDLVVPGGAHGLVVFAHGSGSSRHSPRNRYVAGALQQAGLGTLLVDLLDISEEAADLETAALRFDIGLLAGRLDGALAWAARQPITEGLRLGLFGASTGAAAALMAAARAPQQVQAIVSRGGRPDLAGEALTAVRTPTLLIVGGRDEVVIDLNREALAMLPGVKRLEIIPRATHLFEEPGALEAVAELAREWFLRYLTP